jgi:hypothetical protein
MRAIRWILWFPFRVLGLLLLLSAVFAAGLDILKTARAAKVTTTELGSLWRNTEPDSLLLLQPGVERHISPELWPPIQWLLEQPAFVSLGIVAIVLLLIAWILRPSPVRRRQYNID